MIPILGKTGCIVEGIVTTLDAQGAVHAAPMGPVVSPKWDWLVLRPFPGSRTYDNLLRDRVGVFHVTDDVELIAQAAIGTPDPFPASTPCNDLDGAVLNDACRWYAFRIETMGEEVPRPQWTAHIVGRGAQREFLGFNRAKHAVIEAAILATRKHLLSLTDIETQMKRLIPLVEKTGDARDRRTFAMLADYLGVELT